MAVRISEATEVQAVPVGYAPGAIVLGRYEIEDQLGLGGCGLVLRARDRVLEHTVALKILRPDVVLDRQMAARLMREAHAISQLSSAHVVRIFDAGHLEDGAPYLVMELLHGRDLGELLAAHGALAVPVAVDFVLQACEALAEAHALGIVHRDVKPSNLFVVERPDGSQLVKVLDFGISKSPVPEGDFSLTQTALMLGTPSYMSPEQMRSARAAGPRSDLWALGAVLYELVEGRLPIIAESFAELIVAVSTQPPAPMTRAPQLAPVIARCLVKDPDQRYANVAELAAELARFTSRPIGRACAARSARVLGLPAPAGIARAVTATAMTRPRSGPSSPPAASPLRRRLAVTGALVAALAIPAMVITARRADRVDGTDRVVRVASPPAEPSPAPVAQPAPAADAAATSSAPPPGDPSRAGSALAIELYEAVAPVVAGPAPDPPVRAAPVPATAPAPVSPPATRPARPQVHHKARARAANRGCDPYARPQGC